MHRRSSINNSRPLNRQAAETLAETLRAVADPTRVQLLDLIIHAPAGRALVGDLAATLGLTQPTVSHHVRLLADGGLLDRHQEGRLAWYSVRPDRLGEVLDVLRPDATVDMHPAARARVVDTLATRFRGRFSRETIERCVAESRELLEGRPGGSRYLSSQVAAFAGERLEALGRVDGNGNGIGIGIGIGNPHTIEVLFVCVRNAGRSQMAAAMLRSMAGDRVNVRTAGSRPAASVHPTVVIALDEIGVALGGDFPKPLTDEAVRSADVVVTMGCGDACPIYPGRRYLDWDLADPVGLPLDGVRAVRDDIAMRVRGLLAELT